MTMANQPVPTWMKPLWVRLLFIVLPGAWAIVEALQGQALWAVLFGAASLWGLWTLIIKFDDSDTPPPS
jgi:hypothetical protein